MDAANAPKTNIWNQVKLFAQELAVGEKISSAKYNIQSIAFKYSGRNVSTLRPRSDAYQNFIEFLDNNEAIGTEALL